MMVQRSFFTSAFMSMYMIAFCLMFATTVNAANSVINYTTSNGSVAVPQGYFSDASGKRLSVISSSTSKLQFDGEIKSIGSYAFHNCSALTSLTLPNSVTSIGFFAFSNCTKLNTPIYNTTIFARLPINYNTTYTIADGIKEIASAAFRNCTSLPSVTISNSVTKIDESAFAYCTSLSSITIPNNTTTIDEHAFEGCSNLKSIYVGSTPAQITASTFNHVDKSTCVLYVPKGSLAIYKSSNFWKEFQSIKEYTPSDSGESNIEYTEKVVLTDGDPYTNKTQIYAALFSYSRMFSSTKWGTIVFPVAFEYKDWSSKFEIAEISDVNVTLSNGKISSFSVQRRVLGEGEVTTPNKPYMIRAKVANSTTKQTISKTNCIVYPAENQTVEHIKGKYSFKFTGTYTRIAAPNLYGKYFSSGGEWVACKKTSSMGPMRVYLEIDKVEDSTTSIDDTEIYTAVMKFADGDEYTGKTEVNASIFSYSRKFSSTKWGSIILPVALEYDDWCSNFEIAEISDVDVTLSNGVLSSFSVQHKVLGKGAIITPNKPYLIRAKVANSSTAQTISKKNCVVYPADPQSIEITSGSYSFIFRGTYNNIAAPNLYGYYFTSGGEWIACKTTSSMKAMRDYLEIIDNSCAWANERNNETDIDEMEEDHNLLSEPVKVSSRMIGLAPGTYNINGRLMIVVK
ncbi:MAG: leucine-rich repeat domain-containing protein [Bacteroidales bacterium]|nr:leucine-rich repeat domain-containing protein [Bacteroidales bacterium]